MNPTREDWNTYIRPALSKPPSILFESDLIEFGAKALDEIYRLKELLYTIREVAIADFNDAVVGIADKGIEENFRIPQSRFKEILESL